MKRRSMLWALSALPAGTLLKAQQPVVPPKPSPAAVEEIPVIEATNADLAGSTVAAFFSPEQFAALSRLCDLIVPPLNGVPGALVTQAPQFLDFLIGQSPKAWQTMYCQGLEGLNSRAQKEFQKSFAELNSAQADEILAPLRTQ